MVPRNRPAVGGLTLLTFVRLPVRYNISNCQQLLLPKSSFDRNDGRKLQNRYIVSTNLRVHGRELFADDEEYRYAQEEAKHDPEDDGTREPQIVKLVSILLDVELLGRRGRDHPAAILGHVSHHYNNTTVRFK